MTKTLPVPVGTKRKHVSDEQMRLAQENKDNRNIIHRVLAGFSRRLSQDDLRTCGLHALWKALAYHDDGFGQKFTTSLFRFTHWECKREIRRQGNLSKGTVSLAEAGDVAYEDSVAAAEDREDIAFIRERMGLLPKSDRQLIQEYYVDRWTLDEIGVLHDMSKAAVAIKLELAVRRLRDVCEELPESVYSDTE